MTTVKNTLQKTETLLEPAIFVSFAYLAGSSRFIKYFPNSSKEGLISAACFASATSYLYNRLFKNPDDSYLKILLSKVVAIASGTALAFYTLHATSNLSLNRRTTISFFSAKVLIAIECLATALILKLCYQTPLQKEHRYYSTHLKEWNKLDKEERARCIINYYHAGLPAFSLFNFSAPVSINCLGEPEEIMKKAKSYSTQQLGWIREVFQSNAILFCDRKGSLKLDEHSVELLLLFEKKGIPMLKWNFLDHFIHFIENSPQKMALTEIIYQEFSKDPLFAYLCEGNFEKLFKDKPKLATGNDSIENVLVTVKKLKQEDVNSMNPETLECWHAFFDINERDLDNTWDSLESNVKVAFIKKFFELGFELIELCSKNLGDLAWVKPLIDNEIDGLSSNQKSWAEKLLSNLTKSPKN